MECRTGYMTMTIGILLTSRGVSRVCPGSSYTFLSFLGFPSAAASFAAFAPALALPAFSPEAFLPPGAFPPLAGFSADAFLGEEGSVLGMFGIFSFPAAFSAGPSAPPSSLLLPPSSSACTRSTCVRWAEWLQGSCGAGCWDGNAYLHNGSLLLLRVSIFRLCTCSEMIQVSYSELKAARLCCIASKVTHSTTARYHNMREKYDDRCCKAGPCGGEEGQDR